MNATHLRRRDDCKTNGYPELPDDRRAFRDDRLSGQTLREEPESKAKPEIAGDSS
jgi:hypothetical protein